MKIFITLLFPLLILSMASCKKDYNPGHNASEPITIDRFIPSEGSGGVEMMIFGNNFSTNIADVEVTINGVKAKITGVTKDRILLIVPEARTGLVEVKIGNSVGKSATAFKFPPIYQWRMKTLAGTGVAGFADGDGKVAQFNFVRAPGLSVDAAGNVYVADAGNNRIRKITPDGVVTTLAGQGTAGSTDGTGEQARFDTPFNVAVDKDQNVYVADTWNAKLRKISRNGTVSTVTGVGDIVGLAVDPRNGQVYVGSLTNGAVYRVEPNGNLSAVVTNLGWTSGITINQQGIMYIVETGKSVIHSVDLKAFAGNPLSTTIIAGTAGVAGYEDGTGTSAKFDRPWGIAVDAATGNLYVAGDSGPYGGPWYNDGGNHTDQSIRFINVRNNNVSTFFGGTKSGFKDGLKAEGLFNNPTGVATGPNGEVYVVDANNHSIRKIYQEEIL